MVIRGMSQLEPAVFAVDLGASSLRAAVIGAAGTVSCRFGLAHRTEAEADPARGWAALHEVGAEVARAAGPQFDAVQAVCITGMTRTQVLLDADGRPVRPAMTLAHASPAALPELEHPEAVHLNPYHPAARLLWLARHE